MSNVNNVVVQDGSIEGFQAGILTTGSQNVKIKGIVAKNNQIGLYSTSSSIVNAHLSIIMNNQIGILEKYVIFNSTLLCRMFCNTNLVIHNYGQMCINYTGTSTV